MSSFLNQLRDADAEKKKIKEDPNIVVLDLRKDPDPHGNHGISFADRLRAMGWPG